MRNLRYKESRNNGQWFKRDNQMTLFSYRCYRLYGAANAVLNMNQGVAIGPETDTAGFQEPRFV